MVWGPLKKGLPFGISASIRIGQGSHCHPYAKFFTGILETGFEDKQGEYENPLLIKHKKINKKNWLVMNFVCCLWVLTFWKCPKLQRKQVICVFILAF